MSLFGSLFSTIGRSLAQQGEKASTTLLTDLLPQTRRILLYAGAIFSTGALFQSYLFTFSVATGASMYPTMPIYDHTLWIDMRKKYGKGVALGDCVQIANPIFRGENAGKRIIGMPGDYIVRDPNCAASVGGAPVPGITDWRSDDEMDRNIELKDRTEPEMIEVPEGHVWMAGDNMSVSRDSRLYGAVPMALIRGRSVGISENLFSYTKLQPGLRRIPKDEEEAYLKGLNGVIVEDEVE